MTKKKGIIWARIQNFFNRLRSYVDYQGMYFWVIDGRWGALTNETGYPFKEYPVSLALYVSVRSQRSRASAITSATSRTLTPSALTSLSPSSNMVRQ